MYLAVVLLFMLILPAGSVALEMWAAHPIPLMLALGKWFVFWGVGARLASAGLRQYFQPAFTAKHIFHMESAEALPLVRELGVSNFAIGIVALVSLWWSDFRLPLAIIAAIFYGIAGIRHVLETGKSRNETIAMISDLFIAIVLAAYAVAVMGKLT
jgi:hypothetical protein